MESSEDDAGAATIASRRASARETDVGHSEDTSDGGCTQENTSRARGACDNAVICEEAADDGHSLSTDDTASTDDIINMIDQFVGGYDAKQTTSSLKSASSGELELCAKSSEQATGSNKVDSDIPSITSVESENSLQASASVVTDSPVLDGSHVIENEIETRPVPDNASLDSAVPDNVSETSTGDAVLQSDSEKLISSVIENAAVGNSSVVTNNPIVTKSVTKSTVPDAYNEAGTPLAHNSSTHTESPVVTENASVSACPTEAESSTGKEYAAVAESCTGPESGVVAECDYVTSGVGSENCVVSESTIPRRSPHSDCVLEEPHSNPPVRENCDNVSDAPALLLDSTECDNSRERTQVSEASSSVVETVQNISIVSECESSDRTVKCVSSSENKDICNAEEPTCSYRPARRRLVRPMPVERQHVSSPQRSTSIERRPDTTVSSTVDSLTCDIEMATDNATKHVSSSSDAVTTRNNCSIYDRVNLKNTSEVSVCKAETSVSPKRIKLIRNKNLPLVSQRDNSSDIKPSETVHTTLVSASAGDVTAAPSTSTDHTNISTSQSATDNKSGNEREEINVNKICDNKNTESDNCKDNVTLSKEESVESAPILPEIPVVLSKEIENNIDHKRVEPLKLNLSVSNPSKSSNLSPKIAIKDDIQEDKLIAKNVQEDLLVKQVPKLTIKFTNRPESPIPKLTIKPLKPPSTSNEHENDINTMPVPNVTKLNIKPIQKPAATSNEVNQKSSSSEISESESSENDESATSTSDQASASEQGNMDSIPKVTIKLGKPGTVSEGQFYTEKAVPKLTIKTLQNEEEENDESFTKMRLKVCQSDDKQYEKIPKLTIKPLTKPDSQPSSPKLIIKPIKPPENAMVDEILEIKVDNPPIPKLKISHGSLSPSIEAKDVHIPKLTIKPVVKMDDTSKVPVVTKLNIKPIVKPDTIQECENTIAIPKLNIKTIKQNDYNTDEVPVVSKLNIKPLRNPNEEELSHAINDSNEWNSKDEAKNIPLVTKLNIKPIVKPYENDSKSETENSSDENPDIPVVTKINIKPVLKPDCENVQDKVLGMLNIQTNPMSPKICDQNMTMKPMSPKVYNIVDGNTDSFVGTKIPKLNIKPISVPSPAPTSPKINDNSYHEYNSDIPNVSKLNIKPLEKPVNDETLKESAEDDKKPPIVMKINLKSMTDAVINDSIHNALNVTTNSLMFNDCDNLIDIPVTEVKTVDHREKSETIKENCNSNVKLASEKIDTTNFIDTTNEKDKNPVHNDESIEHSAKVVSPHHSTNKQTDSPRQNCTLLKQLLEVKRSDNDLMKTDNGSTKLNDTVNLTNTGTTSSNDERHDTNTESNTELVNSVHEPTKSLITDATPNPINTNTETEKSLHNLSKQSVEEHCNKTDVGIENKSIDIAVIDDNLRNPLEIITEKLTETSGQESPRIILKINKTDHGTSAKIITEEPIDTSEKSLMVDNTQHDVSETPKPTKNVNRRKQTFDINTSSGKRLRSSKVIEELIPVPKKVPIKKPIPLVEDKVTNPSTDMSLLDAKRIKLGQILSSAAISITKINKTSPDTNHVSLHNDANPKNGSSKLQGIFGIANSDNASTGFGEKPVYPELESNTSTSSDVVEIVSSPPEELLINENSNCQVNFMDELSQDPLDDNDSKGRESIRVSPEKVVLMTPQPRKRGRPRKLPVSEGTRPALPVSALEERPQRSLRLTRDRPSILLTPRGRRGRGARARVSSESDPLEDGGNPICSNEVDPTSARVKLPRLTEAFTKCLEEGKDFSTDGLDEMPMSPEFESPRGRGYRGRGRGSRGGKTPKTPGRMRGRGRGGGRGAMYMKETLGIYGRVCGPSTTTVQLFEEETCMMDDNATPSKMAHLLDEDSQSSVKSSTNESSKPKKSKFAGLFDSNKTWTAADVKEYTWSDKGATSPQVMMIQEQVAMFLEVKSFKRKYPELKRRTITAEERDYILSRGIVTEALCDLGITAVDAGEVLDIMLSDFPHKYEEYRTYQRDRQLTDDPMEVEVTKVEETKVEKVEVKVETKVEKPEPIPEKTRQDMAAAAIASASEWNTRFNAIRRPACVDMQSMIVHQRRPATMPAPKTHVVPPSGYYPHALLPGQYQHWYRPYTSEQMNCYPLNTVLSAPPPPVEPSECSSDSEPEWAFAASSSEESDNERSSGAKRRKVMKKPTRPVEPVKLEVVEEPESTAPTCRTCGLREESNRKVAHERFLVCGNCDAKLHPSCLELSADTIRKCRDYAWQCPECKSCGSCSQPADDDKMLFCDLCDRGFHYYCVGLSKVPSGRWHCVDCAICKSCGARTASGVNQPPDEAAEWHHQSKRGPGGHKIYSHSLCTPCQRAYRIGRYCPLCERSFIGPKGTMQLVICKLCDRQLHQDCVRPTVSQLNIMDYTCGECRRTGITSRSAAVRLAPRTIATLFMAKRRFNKYVHRQYMQSLLKAREEAEAELDADADMDAEQDGGSRDSDD